MTYEIKDNLLDPHYLTQIQEAVMGGRLPWFFNGVLNGDPNHSYFIHTVYENNSPRSELFDLFKGILTLLDAKAIVRIKCNLYPKTSLVEQHPTHFDQDYPLKGAVFYVNSNDGFTVIGEDKIESVENRVLLFDSSILHSSTSCTNQNARFTINFNYF